MMRGWKAGVNRGTRLRGKNMDEEQICECNGCEWCIAGCENTATKVKFGYLHLCDECADFGTQPSQ